jgi:hypothetical protein
VVEMKELKEQVARELARFDNLQWEDLDDKTVRINQGNTKEVYLRRADQILSLFQGDNCEYSKHCHGDIQAADYCPLESKFLEQARQEERERIKGLIDNRIKLYQSRVEKMREVMLKDGYSYDSSVYWKARDNQLILIEMQALKTELEIK